MHTGGSKCHGDSLVWHALQHRKLHSEKGSANVHAEFFGYAHETLPSKHCTVQLYCGLIRLYRSNREIFNEGEELPFHASEVFKGSRRVSEQSSRCYMLGSSNKRTSFKTLAQNMVYSSVAAHSFSQ